jgi:hypothetical protein
VTAPISFTSSIDLPDGRRIHVSLDIPADHPAGLAWEHVGENSEITHMAAVRLMALTLTGDKDRAKRRAEEIQEMNDEIMAKLSGQVPF